MALLLSDTIPMDMAAGAELDIDAVDCTLSDYLRRQAQQASSRYLHSVKPIRFPVLQGEHATDLCASCHGCNHSNQHGHDHHLPPLLPQHDSMNSRPKLVSCESCLNSSENPDKRLFNKPGKLLPSDELQAKEIYEATLEFAEFGPDVLCESAAMTFSSFPSDANNAPEETRRLDLLVTVATLKLMVMNRSGHGNGFAHKNGEDDEQDEQNQQEEEEMVRISEKMPRMANYRRAITAQKLRDLIHRLGIIGNQAELDRPRKTNKRHDRLTNKIHHRKRKRLQDLSAIRIEEAGTGLKVEQGGYSESDEVVEMELERDIKKKNINQSNGGLNVGEEFTASDKLFGTRVEDEADIKKNSNHININAGFNVKIKQRVEADMKDMKKDNNHINAGFTDKNIKTRAEADMRKQKSMESRSPPPLDIFKKDDEIMKDVCQQSSSNVNEIQIDTYVPISDNDDDDDGMDDYSYLDDDNSKMVSDNPSCPNVVHIREAQYHNTMETQKSSKDSYDEDNTLEDADVFRRPKRLRSQVMPTKFSDSILQPWGRIIR